MLCLQPNLNKFMGMGRPAWKEARATLQRILSCMLWFDLIDSFGLCGVLLFGFKVFGFDMCLVQLVNLLYEIMMF